MPTNYFDSAVVAERYAYARPDLNGRFNRELFRLTGRLGVVADFGCGTGLSSRALAEVADTVVGLDPSLAMLRNATSHPRVFYCAGTAEDAPFAAGSFDLVAAGLALHWFDREAFLAEAARVLVPRGWLFISNTWFAGTLEGRADFVAWNREEYQARFPNPPRSGAPVAAPDAPAAGFTLRRSWSIEAEVPMSREELALYLTTQSNVSAAVERGGESIETATNWLYHSVGPFFDRPEQRFGFGGTAWLLQRETAGTSHRNRS